MIEVMELTLGDGSTFKARCFNDFVLLRFSDIGRSSIATVGRRIFESDFDFVDEVIATEVEICLAVNGEFQRSRLCEIQSLAIATEGERSKGHYDLPVFINHDHEDWELIEGHTSLGRLEYTRRLLNSQLSVAMTGFLPGFVYINGLPSELHVPRKSRPSTTTPSNSFAIGGKYAGIYSLASPAGWNCIGRIGIPIFDGSSLPPVSLEPGDSITLKQIDQPTFEKMFPEKSIQESRSPIPEFDENRGRLRIEKPGLYSLIQDQGRKGLAWYAIPRSGAMDFTSAELANTIVGNVPGAPVMECHLVAPRIRFESDATICLTGANMNWHIDNLRVERNRTISIAKGSVLDGSTAVTGSRGYIAIRGEIETSHSFGSASTYTPAGLGGNHGRSLTREDRLQWIKSDSEPFPIHVEIESVAKSPEFELEPGPEFDWMEKESIVALCDNEFRITSQSDRMGARLDGPTLSLGGKRLADSVPLLPGMVQLTPDGKCIVVLQDGQTTGGYPRIGYLDESAVERLNQTKIGQSFRFRITDSR